MTIQTQSPYIDRQSQLRKTQHIDLVSRDTYIHDSLPSSTEEKGKEYGGGCSAKRTSQTTGRGFSVFLIHEMTKKSHAILVYVTDKDSVLCPHQEAVTDYIIITSPCNQEKADMSVIILVFDSARKGSQKLLIRTLDCSSVVMDSLWYKEEISLSGSSRDQPSSRISKIKSASDVSFIHKMRYGVGIGRKRQNDAWSGWGVYPKITESFKH